MPLRFFDGQTLTYGERRRDAETRRRDPNGFYHGMVVRHGSKDFALAGPPAVFLPGQTEQLSLL